MIPCEPVFAEPWQAQAFAMVLALHRQGHFDWTEWADALAVEIASNGEQDYYLQWLAALETLAVRKGLTSTLQLAERRDEWDRAARATPHGQPIQIRAR